MMRDSGYASTSRGKQIREEFVFKEMEMANEVLLTVPIRGIPT
jgi:hypothetical protein